MASPYSHLQFFRRVPNALLSAYFQANNSPLAIDLTTLKENDTQTILDAFLELPPDEQASTEAAFQEIDALACEAGVIALHDEASFHEDDTFVDDLAGIDGLHAKVMWAYLNKHSYWQGANMFLYADNISFAYWKKRNDLPQLAPHVEDVDIELLAKAISSLFKKEGRGKNCKVEPYRRNDREYFFAYPEDYARSGVEWVSNTLKTLAHHPAFEIIFVYCEAEGSLDIYAPKNTSAVPELQKAFAKTILKLDTLKDGSIDKRVYDLAPVSDPKFNFVIEPESGIDSVVVTKMRVTLKDKGKRRVTLEADTRENPLAVYNLLELLDLPPYNITQLGIKVTFESINGKRGKTRSFNITYPNSCALNNDGQDLRIRKMLAESGLEPMNNPEPETE